MEKSKKAGGAIMLQSAFVTNAERMLLSHVEMCYSVALALTRDPILGQRLARATLLWAWQRQSAGKDLGAENVKMALLRELRRRFLSDYQLLYSGKSRRTAAFGPDCGTGNNPVSAVAAANHAETGTAG